MERFYLNLQKKRFDRHCLELGLNPILVYILAPILFILVSELLFLKTDHAGYVLVFLALSLTTPLTNSDRVEFLNSLLHEKYIRIRLLENAIISFPFIIILLIKMQWAPAVILLLASLLSSFWKQKIYFSKSYTTIFSSYPFEYPSGIRISLPTLLLAYFLCGIGIYVDNYNLSAFSLGLVLFISLLFYSYQEVKYFIWIHDLSVFQFIMHKSKISLIYASILAFPIILSLSISKPENIWILVVIIISGFLNLINIIHIKYAVYPNEIGIIDTFIILICLIVPPVSLFSIYYYHKKLTISLKPILHD